MFKKILITKINFLALLFLSITSCHISKNESVNQAININQDTSKAAEKNNQGFVISGKVQGIADQKIYLKLKAVDNVKIQLIEPVDIVNGEFKFEGFLENPPALVNIEFEQGAIKLWDNFVIDNSAMSLLIEKNNSSLKGALTDSPSHDAYSKFINHIQEISKEVKEFAKIYRTLGNNGELPEKDWSTEDRAQLEKMRKISEEADIKRNNYLTSLTQSDNELIKLFAIPDLFHWGIKPFDTFESCEKAFNQVSYLLNRSHLRKFYSYRIFEKSEHVRLRKEADIGRQFKDFSQSNQYGEIIAVSDLLKPGEYLLLDFWASWCGPCRAENPNLLKAYNQYNVKGFNVLAVSLDDNKADWLQAIKEDGMPWVQLSSLNGYDNEAAKLYAVTGIPSSFLLDETGKIIAKDLRGDELEKKLLELLGE